MEQTKKRPGAPKKAPENRLIQKSGRMLPAAWAKIDRNGGWPWLRALVAKAKDEPIK